MTELFCKDCESVVAPGTATPGSIWIELVLWMCFLVPGLIYSLWRINRRREVCATCGSANLVPRDSPVAVRIVGPVPLEPRRSNAASVELGRKIGRMFARK